MKFYAAIFALVAACSHAKDEPPQSSSTSAIQLEFNRYQNRLVSMLDSGWVVSRDQAGAAMHQGDSLIWSGVALGILDCDVVTPIENAMIQMLDETGGKLYRHPTLKGEVSLDGAIGLYYGISEHLARCPVSLGLWTEAIARNPGFSSDPLNADQAVNLTPEWNYLRDLLKEKLAGGASPSAARAGLLSKEVSAWALGVRTAKSSCYRVNLGWLTLQTLESLDQGEGGRDAFCSAASGLELPVVQNYCGDSGPLESYISDFKENDWEFRHQRCTNWETPDGQGLETPALDLLLAMREAYKLSLR